MGTISAKEMRDRLLAGLERPTADLGGVAERLRHYATKVHHEPMESTMREAAELIESLLATVDERKNKA